MTAWIVDDTPLDLLANVVDAKQAALWTPDDLFVADATWAAGSGRRKELLAGAPPPFNRFEILMGTEAADIVFTHLKQPASSTANLAEFQSIAWALAERDDAIFVTTDKRATVIALAELGRGRVAHAFDLWLLFKNDGRVDQSQFERLCRLTRKADQSLPNLPRRCGLQAS